MRSETRVISVERRTDVLYAVHGEVHGDVEYGQQAVYCTDTTREWKGERFDVLRGALGRFSLL